MSAEVTTLLVEDASPQMLSPSPQQRAKVHREDSLKILDPSRKKLSSLETQRIAGVAEDCISRVEMVAMLPAVLARLDSLSSRLDKELTAALREHQHLGERLERLESLNQGSSGGEEGEVDETKERERAQLERAFQGSLRNVLRLFRAHPAAACVLKLEVNEGDGVSKNMQCLVGGLRELHGVLLEKLLTSPAEEQERSRYIQEVSSRHDNNMELMTSLETEVAAAIKDRDTEISEKNEVIKNLKSTLHQEEKISEDFVTRTKQEAEKQSQSDAKTSEGKQTRMQQEINQLKVQLNNLILENREAETALRKKKYKVETKIENWIQKYDADMGEKQSELEEMAAVYEEEKEELREQEEAYAVLELEYSQIQEERRLAEERIEEEKRDLEFNTRASIVIQALWRGYRVRKAMKGKGKGKKGKTGKGKKGKKGK